VKNKIGERIRRIRSGKGLTLANVAHELDITTGAYAKIERGETDPSIGRLLQIAQILEVNIASFLDEELAFNDGKPDYGYASKSDVENLSHLVNTLIKEMEKLRSELPKEEVKKKGKKQFHSIKHYSLSPFQELSEVKNLKPSDRVLPLDLFLDYTYL
jgi:transcriptional regulator with XRE-family HTH domain